MTQQHDRELARELLAREALYLDTRQWGDWLDLYEDDAVFWVPAWRDETNLIQDPETELSFIYLRGKALLEERVRRLGSERSAAGLPLPRTVHMVTGSVIEELDPEHLLRVSSAWSSHIYVHKDNALLTYAGRYEHTLVRTADAYRIQSKKIILANDFLIAKLDFFYV
ncbi:aromatic-ring-hydroxylating dioxygenase subunit beta [Candidimonas humi]|uniref:Aromatic-ring-hydroxylating dioxygenase subunit beta n=1 Tax=Candidimonas humi TaxID=683355 RepID=A0ABV8NWU0_9BURK|nr:aromatic-ring-hydroxylating dioxygenase subunit beta [Candidimonas humi]MBV6304752.1 aromatic-ring-hydroxylating dioxygenase subunit beta [Candidimonas humi]